jgi:geranylgeranylglycerol-phosphate geranylgeranyltransferase
MKIYNFDRAENYARPPRELSDAPVRSIGERLSGFLTLIRPFFFVLTPVNAAAAAVLALGGYPSLRECLLGFFAVAFASCAVNVFNDYTDRARDKAIWPNRPIPSGKVKSREALLVIMISLAISLSIAWLAFYPLTFSILLLAIILGGFYSTFLRDRVGYLSLPPIVGMIYLGGWAAFSPATLFSSWLPWYLYLLGVVWQAAHIMIYYPLHVVNTSAGSPGKAPRALFFRPSPKVAVKIGIVFTCLTLALAVSLVFTTTLGVLYLSLVIIAGLYALISGLRLRGDVLDKTRGLKAFKALSVFRFVISVSILLSVLFAQAGWL